MSRTVAAIAFASLSALAGHAQSPGAVTIPGRVLAAETGDPIPHARVVLFNDAALLSRDFTDRDGRFVFASLPTGRYHLSVTKAGYAATAVPRPGEAGADGVEVRMPRSSAISGRVADPFGEPLAEIAVTVSTRGPGRNGNGPGNLEQVKITRTNDLGEYRLGGLSEGSFLVAMLVAPPGSVAQVPTYYPGVANLNDAQPIVLRAGDEKAGIDFVGAPIPPPGPTTVIVAEGPGLAARVQTRGGASAPAANSTAIGTGTISGRVTRADGLPLPRAVVTTTFEPGGGGPRTVSVLRFVSADETDENGRFEVSGLPSGSYRLSASKPGYTGISYGQRSAEDRGEWIRLADGESRSRVDLVLPRHGSLNGRIVDEFGDPIEGIQTGVGQIRFQAGRRRLVVAAGAAGQTDDLGRYRIYGLQPGRYILTAVAGQVTPFQPTPDLPGYAPTYFPGSPSPTEAQPVSVGLSQDVVGVDFSLVPVPTARITGRTISSNDEPLGGSLVLVPSHRSGAIVTPPTGARTYSDGRFEFPNVPPGDYVIQADSGRRGASMEGEFATQFVTVNGADVADVLVRSSTGSTIRGRVIFEGDVPPQKGVTILPARADLDRTPLSNGSLAHGDMQPDMTFEMSGIHGPRRLTLDQAPAGWVLKAVLVNGIDVTDTPLPFGSKEQSLSDVEVVLVVANRLTELTGAVRDARGNPATFQALVVFPSDRDHRYPGSRYWRRSITNSTGAFRFGGLPPGDYLVAAIARVGTGPDIDGDDWQDPEFLDSLEPRAARVTLAEGQKLAVNPPLIGR